MIKQDRFRESGLGRAKPKRSFLHHLANVSLKRHRSDTGLVEDRTSSVTIVRIIVGLLMIHLIVIGGVLLRGQMVKEGTGTTATAAPIAPPPAALAPPPTGSAPAAQDALPRPTLAPAAPTRSALASNHITQVSQSDAVAEEPEVEAVIITPPTPAAGAAAQAEPLRHLVAPGDTIYRISNQYGVSEAALKAANPSLNQGRLRSGTTLVIPVDGYTPPAAAPAPARPAAAPRTATAAATTTAGAVKTYTVQRGENLSRISRKVNVPIKTLMELNGLSNADRISPGMELRLSR